MIRINLKMLFFKQIIAIRSFPQVPEEYDIIQHTFNVTYALLGLGCKSIKNKDEDFSKG